MSIRIHSYFSSIGCSFFISVVISARTRNKTRCVSYRSTIFIVCHTIEERQSLLKGPAVSRQSSSLCLILPITRPQSLWNLTLFRLGGGGFSNPPSSKIVITPTPKELWRSNFLTFPKIYLGTFWYNYYVDVINHVAMATSFWHIGFGKFQKWWFFCFKIAFLHL